MHKCPECGYVQKEVEGFDFDKQVDSEMDDDAQLKTDVLSELQEMLSGSLENKLKSKKPSMMSVEIESLKPKDEEEEEV